MAERQQQHGEPPLQPQQCGGGYAAGLVASLLPLPALGLLLAASAAVYLMLVAARAQRRRRAAAADTKVGGNLNGILEHCTVSPPPSTLPPSTGSSSGMSSGSTSAPWHAAPAATGTDPTPIRPPATPEPLPAPPAAHALLPASPALSQQSCRLVRAALPDGTHHVSYGDGSAYYGEWRGGKMHGRGIFVWPSGEQYEGEWQDGLESGTGTFVLEDASTYYGSWQGGQMHGMCVFLPTKEVDGAGDQVVYLQQYDHGRLVQEQVLRVAEEDVRKKVLKKKQGKKNAKREAKQLKKQYRAPKPGEAVYKGHRSYDLMQELQLGITFSIAHAEAAESGKLQEVDFFEETTQYFPPGAETGSYKWKDYVPKVFQRLRQSFGINNIDYLLSLTGDAALRMLGSPGKSGSVFFLSDDDRFLVKTVGKEEMRLLLKLIPCYYHHVCTNPATLLVRFYGVHRVTPLLGRRVRFIVMGNVLPSDLCLHRRYDLKGSTYGRTAGEEERAANPHCTLKDLDVDMQLILPARQYEAAVQQMARDLELLECLHVIDYSLLLGVHFTRWGNDAWHPPFANWPADPTADGGGSEANPAPITRLTTLAAAETGGEGGGPVATSSDPTLVAAVALAQLERSEDGSPPASPVEAANFWRLHSSFEHQHSSIDASNALAALMDSLDQQQQAVEAAREQPDNPAQGTAQQLLLLQQGQDGGQGAARLESLPLSLRHAAASLLQAANQSRVQARLSAMAALQAAAGEENLPGGGGTACQQLLAIPESGSAAHLASSGIQVASGPQGAAAAGKAAAGVGIDGRRRTDQQPPPLTVPLVVGAERHDPRHWWLDRSCGLGGAVCLGGSSCLPAGEEHWVCHPPPPHQHQQQPQAGAGTSGDEPQADPFVLLSSIGGGGGGPDDSSRLLDPAMLGLGPTESEAAVATAALVKQQAAGLNRLLSMRGSTGHESVGRSVPAVAVRRAADGTMQCEPVLLFFGIIDFLQDYSARKHVERWWKASVHGGERVSVADPHRYSRRFMHALQDVLLGAGASTGAGRDAGTGAGRSG